jgi:hypothetical protein
MEALSDEGRKTFKFTAAAACQWRHSNSVRVTVTRTGRYVLRVGALDSDLNGDRDSIDSETLSSYRLGLRRAPARQWPGVWITSSDALPGRASVHRVRPGPAHGNSRAQAQAATAAASGPASGPGIPADRLELAYQPPQAATVSLVPAPAPGRGPGPGPGGQAWAAARPAAAAAAAAAAARRRPGRQGREIIAPDDDQVTDASEST